MNDHAEFHGRRVKGGPTVYILSEGRRISSLLTDKPMLPRQRLQRRGERLQDIYFPNQGLCSLVIAMADGATAEIAMVGTEGFVGIEAVVGSSTANCDVIVQVAGGTIPAMNPDAFRQELDDNGALHAIVTTYTQAFVGFVTQSVACNALHSAEARCCRWLLHAQDRLGDNDLALTHVEGCSPEVPICTRGVQTGFCHWSAMVGSYASRQWKVPARQFA